MRRKDGRAEPVEPGGVFLLQCQPISKVTFLPSTVHPRGLSMDAQPSVHTKPEGSHFDALKANSERERAANRRSHLGFHAYIDDEGTPTVFHGYGPDALCQWNKNCGTYKGPFDSNEAAVEWLASLCDRLAERYRKAAEKYRYCLRHAEAGRVPGAAGESPNVAEAACEVSTEVGAEELNLEGGE